MRWLPVSAWQSAGPGRDNLKGNSGDDQLRGGAGDDVLRGGGGKNVLRCGAGKNVLRCGAGEDKAVDVGPKDRTFCCERVKGGVESPRCAHVAPRLQRWELDPQQGASQPRAERASKRSAGMNGLTSSRAAPRAAAAAILGLLLLPAAASADTQTFTYTGSSQTWTVPAGVTSASFDLYGAAGGSYTSPFPGGKGGRATATLSVTPGEAIDVNVGGAAQRFSGSFNGGGSSDYGPGGGGGGTDIRIGGSALADRVLVAGGGGGTGNCANSSSNIFPRGGDGGGLSGGDGGSVPRCYSTGGGGGTQVSGGSPDGALGQGGNGTGGGGGGGGYYGGGGGRAGNGGGGGGGGSGYGPEGTTFQTGVRSGDGKAAVTYTPAFDLTVTTSGSGSGYVSSPGKIDCQTGSATHTDCTDTEDEGASVTLTANPDSASTFTRLERRRLLGRRLLHGHPRRRQDGRGAVHGGPAASSTRAATHPPSA